MSAASLPRFAQLLLAVLLGLPVLMRADTPTQTRALPDRALSVSSGAVSLDLGEHFGVNGVAEGSEIVQFNTVSGTFDILLRRDAAPATVANFLAYVAANRYDNTFIHRSVPNFVIQGGGFTSTLPANQVVTFAPIALEYNLPNVRGSIAMARTDAPNTATSQFFINTVDNTTGLGPGGFSPDGYAVFGRVLGTGMTVVDTLAAFPIYNAGSPFNELPLRNFPLAPPFPSIGIPNLLTINTVRVASIQPGGSGPSVLSYQVSSSDTALVSGAISGRTLTLTPSASNTGTATITVTARTTDGATLVRTFDVTVTADGVGRLKNISTRGRVGTGAAIMIPGFVIDGAAEGTSILLIRAVGPTLASPPFNLPGTLPDPRVQLIDSVINFPILTGDNWHTALNADLLASTAATVGAFPLNNPSNDAAILVDLAKGPHTLFVDDTGGAEGVGLVEVYEVTPAPGQRLSNISTRLDVRSGADVGIAGFVIGDGPVTALIRAVGPTLAAPPFSVPGSLPNPRLRVVQQVGEDAIDLATNDTWHTSPQAAQIAAVGGTVGAFPLVEFSSDAAVLVTLLPGAYTVIVDDPSGGNGIALIEVYEVR